MGIFDFIFKRGDKENFSRINDTLQTSFLNVKKDITHLHKNVTEHKDHTHKKFQHMEERLKQIELLIQDRLYEQPKIQQEEVEKLPQTELENKSLVNILKGLPKAELKLFQTVYELQSSLNAKHISYKSLAKYLYPDKEYNSIRSTITQFVLRLNTEGLIDKKRIGKETYVRLSQTGYKILKNTKAKKQIKEIETQS